MRSHAVSQSPNNVPATSTTSGVNSCPLITIAIAAASLTIMASAALTSAFQFDRTAIAAGELWRVFTGHLTHFDWNHFVWDAGMFVVLGVMCERRHRGRYSICLVGSAVLISIGLWFAHPDMSIYRGLSGIDTALFTLAASYLLAEKWREQDWPWVVAIIGLTVGLLAKIGFEIVTGTTFFVDSEAANFVPIPLAHAIGGLFGIVIATGGRGGRRLQAARSPRGTQPRMQVAAGN